MSVKGPNPTANKLRGTKLIVQVEPSVALVIMAVVVGAGTVITTLLIETL